MGTTKDMIRSFERTRASNIIKAYEEELINKLAAYPNAKNVESVRTIVSRLADIRKQVMGSVMVYRQPIKRDPGGDFSLEEVEAAMSMISAEEENPFK